MKAKISKIILWPKRAGLKPRVVEFRMKGVEVITGKSQTGKSSLIPIIDYCLGSDKCAIPVGRIREATEWFGLILRLPDSEILIARRNPGEQAQTGDMLMEIASAIDVPDTVDGLPQVNVSAVLGQLHRLSELPSLSLSGTDDGGFGGRPSFRDTAAFQFQPQHIVANPYTLFFKADTYEHQEKLKQIFPLVLGAIDGRTLEVRRQIRILDAELKQKRDQLEERKIRSATWEEEFRSFYAQAREFGLLADAPEPLANWTTQTFVGVLASIPSKLKTNPFPAIERGASRRMAKDLASIRREEDSLARTIEDRKRKLVRVERLRSSADDYSKALEVQGDRMQPLPWFAEHIENQHECPVCGSLSASAIAEIQHLVALAKNLSEGVGNIGSVNHVLDKEVAELEEDLRVLEEKAGKVREQLAQLEHLSSETRVQRQTLQSIYGFSGRLEQELRKFSEADRGSRLEKEIGELERKAAEMRRQVDQSSIRQKEDKALDSISDGIKYYAEILAVEDWKRPARLDTKNLTLAISTPSGRRDYLWEIGSAANWMGYHIASLLALHEHFLTVPGKNTSPVPQFLFIDQPSQAFFPERQSTGDDEPILDSDDISRVQRIFKALSGAVKRTRGKLQIVLIEHVGDEAWRDIPEVHLVERWRDSNSLIPSDW